MEAPIPVRLAPKAVSQRRALRHLSLLNTRWGGSSKLEAGVSLLNGIVNTEETIELSGFNTEKLFIFSYYK